nr:uncharacterized protein LOC104651144 [Saimiri boliviensis boliviensis]
MNPYVISVMSVEPKGGGSTHLPRSRSSVGAARGPKLDTRGSPAERVFQQKKGALSPGAGNPSSGTELHSRPASRFRCKQLFGPAREWQGREQRRTRARREGGLKAWAPPARGPRLFLACPRHPRTGSDGKRQRDAGDLGRAPPERAPSASARAPAPALLTCRGVDVLPPAANQVRAGATAEAGATRGRLGRFSLCPSEAASLATRRAVLPARLRWPAVKEAASQYREGGDCAWPGGASPIKGSAMSSYGKASGFFSCLPKGLRKR